MFSPAEVGMQRIYADQVTKLSADYQAQIDALRDQLAAEQRKTKELAFALAISEAHGDAMLAQAKALAVAAGSTPLLKLTGRKNRNGNPEKVIHRDIYNPTFDAALKRAGVTSPHKYRA